MLNSFIQQNAKSGSLTLTRRTMLDLCRGSSQVMLGILTLGQEYLNDFISDLGSPQKNRYILFFSLTSQFVALAIDSISDDNIT